VREHEVLGVTGLIGAGKTELAQALFGVDKIAAGKIYLQGKELKINTPRRAVRKPGSAIYQRIETGKVCV